MIDAGDALQRRMIVGLGESCDARRQTLGIVERGEPQVAGHVDDRVAEVFAERFGYEADHVTRLTIGVTIAQRVDRMTRRALSRSKKRVQHSYWTMCTLYTPRLELRPITVAVVEAMMEGRRADAEAAVDARLPDAWPGRALVEQAFSASLERIRANPNVRLWGDRVMITREGRRVVGSVVFHGAPDDQGMIEIAYGVESGSQQRGYASEGTRACLDWALTQPGVRVVRATTPPWHSASRRVLEKLGMQVCGSCEHPLLGELLEYECHAPGAALLHAV